MVLDQGAAQIADVIALNGDRPSRGFGRCATVRSEAKRWVILSSSGFSGMSATPRLKELVRCAAFGALMDLRGSITKGEHSAILRRRYPL